MTGFIKVFALAAISTAALANTVANAPSDAHTAATADAATTRKIPLIRRSYQDGPLTVDVVDLSPRFLDFYRAAQGSDPNQRFAIWKERYDFAALPPRGDFDAQARKLLDNAWDRYSGAMPAIRAGQAGMRPPVPFGRIARLLGLNKPGRVSLVTYVGGFEDNAFTMKSNGVPTLSLPLESSVEFRKLVGTHEAVHAIHMLTASLDGNYERPVAQMLIEEGLAMRAARAILPGKTDSYYVEHRPGWFAEAALKRAVLLSNYLPLLDKADGQTIFTLTGGTGTTGLQREAYYVAWLVVGELQRMGMTLAEIAHLPQSAMGAKVRAAIAALQAG